MIDPIKDAPDWIARSAAAKARLVAEFGYRGEDFIVVADRDEHEASMNWSAVYPTGWNRHGWLRSIPYGVTLWWPAGTDFSGEAYDADDPLFILSECEFWRDVTPEQIAEMLQP